MIYLRSDHIISFPNGFEFFKNIKNGSLFVKKKPTTFSQQEVETKSHCSELEGRFPPPYLHENRVREILFFLVNIWSVE